MNATAAGVTGKKIMIVDDDKELLEELSEALSASGYYVACVNDSTKALDAARAVNPDVILLDLRMRPMSGFELASRLGNTDETYKIPIIAMSGFYTVKEYEFLMSICRIKNFLKKPVTSNDLLANIESILSTS